jgi:ABC-type glycerol-3-phosphate transport system substrate-binding protein
LLDTQDLWRLVELGMVQPLTDTVSLLPERFYPFAYSSVWIGEELYGIPYASDIIHSASVGSAEQTMPVNWSELNEDGRRYLFPAAGTDGGMSLLLQYIGVGGESIGDDLSIDDESMTRLFEFYASGVADGIFPTELANLATMDAVWSSMNGDGTDIVDTTASYLLHQSESPDGILYAHTPTEEGAVVSVSRTWAFVILTADPGQRAQVLELVQLLLESDVQGQWSQFANLLPTTSAAAATWNVNQPYYSFIISLLEGSTYAIPNGRPFTELLRRIQTAQQDVLSGGMTPEEAVTFVLPTP